MNRRTFFISSALALIGGFASTVYAANETPFTPLVGIPFLNKSGNTLSIEDYVQALYTIAISAAALIVILKLMYAGVKIIFSEGVTERQSAKKDISGTLFGLLIILAAVTILKTINPELTGLNALRNARSFNDSITNILPDEGGGLGTWTQDGILTYGGARELYQKCADEHGIPEIKPVKHLNFYITYTVVCQK